MRSLRTLLTSTRATLAILAGLAILLLLNVLVPQDRGSGREAYLELVSRGRAVRFLLDTVGLGHLPTSPLFLSVVALFFANLVGVLTSRVDATFRRIRFNPPNADRLRSWAQRSDAISHPRPPGWPETRPAEVLHRIGYRVVRPGPGTTWGVKHRTAVVGFPLFHLSFLLLAAGGAMLYYTRFDATLALAEGQTFEGGWAAVLRQMPWTEAPAPAITLDRVDPVLEDGRPIRLAATVRIDDVADGAPQETRINHPLKWGASTLLVERAGIAPVFWLQDSHGFTLDRVTIISAPDQEAMPEVTLGNGLATVLVEPLVLGPGFPERGELSHTSVSVQVRQAGEERFSGKLTPGESILLAGGFLKLEEVRYWAYFRLVHERGGALLMAGFVLCVAGLVWRMLWYRREVGVIWNEDTVFVAGRSEYYPRVFGEELRSIVELLGLSENASPDAAIERRDSEVEA